MLEINRIQTLQYMGSKSRMLDSICTPIGEDNDIDTVIDLFAGTGSVGYALSPYKRIISNDLEYYAYVINDAILNGCRMKGDMMDSLISGIINRYNLSSKCVEDAIDEEERFLHGNIDNYKEYAMFSDETPSIFHPYTGNEKLKSIGELVSRINPGSTS